MNSRALLIRKARCPRCAGPSVKGGFYKGKQKYICRGECRRIFRLDYDHNQAIYPWCVACRLRMKKAGRPQGFQNFRCRRCGVYYRDGARLHLLPVRERKRYLAATRWEQVFEAIRRATASLPAGLREEVIQEMALAAFDGRFDLADINGAAAFYRRKVSRQMDRFRLLSIDRPIGEGLTYADLLAG